MHGRSPSRVATDKHRHKNMRTAFTTVWLIMSCALLFIFMSPYLLPDKTLLSASETLKLQHDTQMRCPLCGMTEAFIAISHGDLDEAVTFNQASVALYGILLSNESLAILFLISRTRRFYCRIVRKLVMNVIC